MFNGSNHAPVAVESLNRDLQRLTQRLERLEGNLEALWDAFVDADIIAPQDLFDRWRRNGRVRAASARRDASGRFLANGR
jgi:hypothetical protein